MRYSVLLAALCALSSPAQSVADFFDLTRLQDIHLTMSPADWRALHDNYQDKKTNYRAAFSWRGLQVNDVGVHTRGTGSLNPIKPGLAVEFDKFVSKQRFLGLQSVILRNFSEDPSAMHEALTMRVFERLGLPFQRTAYARVFVNGVYVALYEMAEPIDSRYLITRFGDDTGYLYEMQGAKGYHFEYLGDDPATYVSELFDPKNHASNPQGEVIAAMVKAINLSTDAAFAAEVGRYIDLGAFVAHVAVEVFMAESDGVLSTSGMANFYFYRRAADNRFFLLPWDKEMTFTKPDWSIWEAVSDNVLLRRALQVPALRARYLDTLHQAVGAVGEGWLTAELDRHFALIREAALADPARVCLVEGAFAPCPAETFLAAVGYARSFAEERGPIVQQAIEAAGWRPYAAVPDLRAGAIRNAASGLPVMAHGGMSFLAAALPVAGLVRAEQFPLPDTLAGVSVEVAGVRAPMILVSPEGAWVQTPPEVPAGPAAVTLSNAAGSSNTTAVELRPADPGIFAVTHLDGQRVTTAAPARRGSWLVVWATGLGRAESDDRSGEPAPLNRLVPMRQPVSAYLGDVPVRVLWAGLAPGFTALQQVIVELPEALPAGLAPFALEVYGERGAAVTLPVQ
jgi:uncharacterized protein (TIGR03437 family)